MVKIQTTCKCCGDVEVTPADLRVRAWGASTDGEYSLLCPTCSMTTVRRANAATIDLLAASGVSVHVRSRSPRRTSPNGLGLLAPTRVRTVVHGQSVSAVRNHLRRRG